MRRRIFLMVAGAGALLSQLRRPLAARSAQAPGLAPRLDVGAVAQLSPTAPLLVRSSVLGPLLVIQDSASRQLKAVNPTCPHRGCLVAWNAEADTFVCPCHQARFNASGRWIGGQTVRRPLASFKVTVNHGRILVSKG